MKIQIEIYAEDLYEQVIEKLRQIICLLPSAVLGETLVMIEMDGKSSITFGKTLEVLSRINALTNDLREILAATPFVHRCWVGPSTAKVGEMTLFDNPTETILGGLVGKYGLYIAFDRKEGVDPDEASGPALEG